MKRFLLFALLLLVFLTGCRNGSSNSYRKGLALYDNNNYYGAINMFSKAIRLDSSNLMAYSYRGNAWQKLEMYNAAAHDFSLVVKKDPNNIRALINLGDCYFKLGNVDSALNAFNTAYSVDNEFELINYNLGVCYFENGEYEKALEHFNKEYELDDNNVENIFYIAHTLGLLGNLDASIKTATNGLAKKELAEGYFIRGCVYFSMSDYNSALFDQNKAIEMNPNDPEFYIKRSAIFGINKEYEKALIDCEKALELDSNFIDAYKTRILINKELGNYEKVKIDSLKIEQLLMHN